MQIEERIEKIFEKAKTEECRTKIAESFAHYLSAVGEEKSLPFENIKFKNGCFFPEADVAANGEEMDPDDEQRLFDEAEAVCVVLSWHVLSIASSIFDIYPANLLRSPYIFIFLLYGL